MTAETGLLLALVAVLTVIVLAIPRAARTLESYFVHDRNLGSFPGSFVYTSAWTQPLALFASGVFAYRSVWHFLAFAVPNVFANCLVVLIGPAIQRAKGDGFTLPEVYEHTYLGVAGWLLRTIFAIFACISLAYTMALNLTMLQQANQSTLRLWVDAHLGVDSIVLSLAIGVVAYAWATPHGIRGAVVGDVMKVLFMLCGVAGIASLWLMPAAPAPAVPFAAFSPWDVFWTFGVAFSVSLVGGAISNPDMVERKYAISKKTLVQSAVGSVMIFSVILVGYGSSGFLAHSLGIFVTKDQLPVIEVIKRLVPFAEPVVIVLVTVVLIASLASALASAGNVWQAELVKRFGLSSNQEETIRWSRALMLITLVGGFAMAIYVNDVAVLLQNMSVVRGEQIAAIFVVLFWSKAVSPWMVLIGVVGGAIGGPYFTFVEHNPPVGACVAFLVPLACCVFGAAWRYAGACKAAKQS